MQVGDTVRVRANRRRALIAGEISHERFQFEFLPDPTDDPLDSEAPPDGDVGGIYAARDLEPLD